MLITQLKDTDSIRKMAENGKVFLLTCHGCREIGFPEKEAGELRKELTDAGKVSGSLVTDYICHPENLTLRLKGRAAEVEDADTVIVFSCGVGVQTAAELLPEKRVMAACDTIRLPGFQGVTPLEHDCGQCGQCYLNITGGVCPITACSKSLVNGPCGGAKAGKCEVDPEMDCGWGVIYRRLKDLGRLDALKCPVQFRDWSTEEVTKACKQNDE